MSSLVTNPAGEDKLKRVVQRIYDLPSFPDVIHKLQEEAEDPKSTAKRMAAVMEKDQGLSAKVLKLVNSAFYSFSKPVSSLQHAITLLGYNSIRSLAMSVSVRSALNANYENFDSEKFWEHALSVATTTRMIAEIDKFSLKEDAFTAGLLHDIGILLIAKYFPEELEAIGKKVREDGMALTSAEEEVLGVDHFVLGAWLAEQWRLPDMLMEPMLRHQALQREPLSIDNKLDGDVQKVLHFVSVADLLVNAMGLNHSLDGESKVADRFDVPEHLQIFLGGKPEPEIRAELNERIEESRTFLAL
ncbi:MAG: HDOD domain-containing protein [Planctomycetota bacterium]